MRNYSTKDCGVIFLLVALLLGGSGFAAIESGSDLPSTGGVVELAASPLEAAPTHWDQHRFL